MCRKSKELSTIKIDFLERIVLAKEVMKIAQAAGAAILEIYTQAEGVEIERKADNSPLTIADRTANKIICDGLEQLAVQYPVISEENKEIPYETRRHFTQHWLVDPLDGTKEFIKRNGDFTVNIALVENQRVVLGVVYIPVTDESYFAVQGEGAFEVKNGVTKRLQVTNFQAVDENLKLVCSRSHLNEKTQNFVANYRNPELVSRGSSLKFLLLAKGEAHIYPRLAPTMEWDTGAAQIILEEAGGSVIDAETNAPLLYNKENLRNPEFIAYGGLTMTELAND